MYNDFVFHEVAAKTWKSDTTGLTEAHQYRMCEDLNSPSNVVHDYSL